MTRLCLALDLKSDDALIQAYEQHHQAVWPAVLARLRQEGVVDLDIYRVENRLFMIMEVDETFDPAGKAARDAADPDVLAWETLMDSFQQRLPNTTPPEKWRLMQRIFSLREA